MITLDTNINVSAFHYDGNPLVLLELALAGEVEIAVSAPIMDETVRALRDKFDWAEQDLKNALEVMKACTVLITPAETLSVIEEDEPDNRILECAVASGSECIVSGDGDLLRLGEHEGIQILRVAEFIRRVQPGDR